MATFSIAGNTGGATGAGATVELNSDRGDIQTSVIADNNGVYSIPNLPDQRTYFLIATLSGKVYRFQHAVSINGANVVDVNFNPTALNASNINTPGF
jgi:hypothetical protein